MYITMIDFYYFLTTTTFNKLFKYHDSIGLGNSSNTTVTINKRYRHNI